MGTADGDVDGFDTGIVFDNTVGEGKVIVLSVIWFEDDDCTVEPDDDGVVVILTESKTFFSAILKIALLSNSRLSSALLRAANISSVSKNFG